MNRKTQYVIYYMNYVYGVPNQGCAVHPGCTFTSPEARFSELCALFVHVFCNELLLLYIRGVHGQGARRMFSKPVRLDGSQNK